MSAAWLKSTFSPLMSHLLPPTLFTFTTLLCSSPVINCSQLSLYFQEITSGPAGLTFPVVLHFSILSFIVFPLSSHTVVSHLLWPSCHASGQRMDTQSRWCKPILCFLSSFVFHPHPALAFLIPNSLMSFYVISLPDFFTLLLLFYK